MSVSKNILSMAHDYLMIALGLACYAFGFTAFILPEKVVTGGVTGLSSLLYFAFDWNVAVTYYLINAALLAVAFRTVGKQFVIRTIVGATLATFYIGVMQPLFPEPIVGQQPFMNIIIGALLCGVGIGTVFVNNGSTAGTDIIAAVVTKHTTISFGRMMLYTDMVIICSSYALFHSIDKIVFALIFMIINSFTADWVINNNRQSYQFFIISKRWEDIANAVNNEAHRGCTVLSGMGWYSKHEVKIVMVMCRRLESVHLMRIIKRTDPEAFITQAKVSGVFGQGFDEMKVKIGPSAASTPASTEA